MIHWKLCYSILFIRLLLMYSTFTNMHSVLYGTWSVMEEVWEWGEVVLRVHSECSLLPTLSSLLLFLCLRCQCEVSTLNRVNLFSSISHFKSFKCDFYYFIHTCKISYINLLSLPDFVTNVGNFSFFPLNIIKLNNTKQICNSTNGFWNMYKIVTNFFICFFLVPTLWNLPKES